MVFLNCFHGRSFKQTETLVNKLILNFREIESIKYNRNNSTWAKKGTKNSKTIHWIEKLLNTPLDDYRKYSIKFILARYLMNIRGLSRQETSDILSTWLNRCDSI